MAFAPGTLRPAVEQYIHDYPEVLQDRRHAASTIAKAIGAGDESVRRILRGTRPGRVYSPEFTQLPPMEETAQNALINSDQAETITLLPGLRTSRGERLGHDSAGRAYAVRLL